MESSYNIADIVIVALLIPAVIGGMRKGFIRQGVALVALVTGIWAGWHFSSLLSEWFKVIFKTENPVIDIIAFAVIFIGVLLLLNLAGHLVSGIVKLALLGWLDKILGVAFALLKYGFILSIIAHILNSLDKLYNFLPQEMLAGSKLYSFISSIAPTLFPYLKELAENSQSLGDYFSNLT